MFDCAQPDAYCVQEIVVHVASYHFDRDGDFNEFNPGVGVHLRLPRLKFYGVVGAFDNSLYRPSVYAGIGKDFPIAGPLAFRLTGALITGYRLAVSPVVFPEVTITTGGYGVAIGYMPKLEFNNGVVESFVSFSLLKTF